MRFYLVAPAAIAVAACTTQAQMDAEPVQRVTRFDLNYQQVFANLNKGARNCYEVASLSSVDAQMYSDLGYGEVSAAVTGGFTHQPIMYAKISRDGSGAVMQSKTAGSRGREGTLNWVEYWARGGLTCPKLRVGETPPAI